MNEEERARRHVRRLREFYVHALMYVVVMAGIVLLNWIISPTFWWVVFPAIGWGIGLAAHGISVFFEDSVLGTSWEERKTRELLQHEERRG